LDCLRSKNSPKKVEESLLPLQIKPSLRPNLATINIPHTRSHYSMLQFRGNTNDCDTGTKALHPDHVQNAPYFLRNPEALGSHSRMRTTRLFKDLSLLCPQSTKLKWVLFVDSNWQYMKFLRQEKQVIFRASGGDFLARSNYSLIP